MSSVTPFRLGSLMLQHLCHSIARESLSRVSGNKRVSISPDLRLKSRRSGPLSAIFSTLRTEQSPKSHPSQSEKKGEVAERYSLSKHLWIYLKNYAAKHRAMGNGFGYGLVGKKDIARTLSARYYKDGSEILIDRGKGRTPRRLTPRECARLMGFDRRGRKPFIIQVSDTRAYKQFGNAVVVPVVEACCEAHTAAYPPDRAGTTTGIVSARNPDIDKWLILCQCMFAAG